MITLENELIRFSVSEDGRIESLLNKTIGVETIAEPRGFWRLIFREGRRDEVAVYPDGQKPVVSTPPGCIVVEYPELVLDGRTLHVRLRFEFRLEEDEITATVAVANDEDIDLIEVCFPVIDGITTLGGEPAQDALIWPQGLGMRIENPLETDFAVMRGYRIYEAPDHLHTDLYTLYPGGASMQWFALASDRLGLYLASYDQSLQSTCLNLRKDVRKHLLSLAFAKYPFLTKGEMWESEPFVFSAYAGDWHMAAKKYRAWASSRWWTAPAQPDWVRNFKGWLRVILKHQYGEILYDYSVLPDLYAQAKAVGFETLFILGWIPGGFSRLWPEYCPDPAMGDEEKLKAAIESIHAGGGKVLVFVSYFLVDRDTDFYKRVGHRISLKNPWGSEYDFSETYSGDGSWRKMGCGRMPLACMCPSTPEWQDEMLDVGRRIMELGADGILYDIGGSTPWFCFDASHPHEKPSHAFSTKSDNYRALRADIKRLNPDAMVAMENTVDVFGQHMDLAHSTLGGWPGPMAFPELYRFTFPEHIVTNRECGEDERDYVTKANYSFVYGLRFDMTIFRCRGTLKDVPNYADYLRRLNAISEEYGDVLLRGTFVDTQGFTIDNPSLVAKAYRAEEQLAVVLWNPGQENRRFEVHADGYRLTKMVTPAGKRERPPRALGPNELVVLIFTRRCFA
jgi:hypothetical protein